MIRHCLPLAVLALAAPGALAQLPAGSPVNAGREAARAAFAEVSTHMTRAAEMAPEARYAFRPANGVRTFGQIVAHVADGYRYYCAAATGTTPQWSDAIETTHTTKAAVVEQLAAALDGCESAYTSGTSLRPLIDNVAHTNLHYGNLVTYLRLLGMVPPSS